MVTVDLLSLDADINVMRMIKLFAWEPKVKSQISDRREKELKLIRRGTLTRDTTILSRVKPTRVLHIL